MLKQAFNKYNPVELISQLVTVLEQEGLEDEALAVRELSRTINQAWMQRKVATLTNITLVKKANLLLRKHLAAVEMGGGGDLIEP